MFNKNSGPGPAVSLAARVDQLEAQLCRQRLLGVSLLLLIAGAAAAGSADDKQVQERLRVRRLELVDDEGRVRLALSQDSKDAGRRSRAAGLTIFDNKGDERGGFSTFDDGSVVMAMDAPRGVGDPMPDRLGMRVYPNGAAEVMVIDNMTRGVAKLASDGQGGGGIQVFKWDMDAKKVHVKTIGYDGEEVTTFPIGG